jgi:NTE family protein
LQRQFAGALIEDLWLPYFAVAADLSLPAVGPCVMRRGPLWEAVRASSAIPAALPPLVTGDGRMLIDGSVVANTPLASMKEIKAGPNLVVRFGADEGQSPGANRASSPSRSNSTSSSPVVPRKIRRVPGPMSVLMRCFTFAQDPTLLPLGPLDFVLIPPIFPGSSFSNFARHTEVFDAAYRWSLGQLDNSKDRGLAAILATATG